MWVLFDINVSRKLDMSMTMYDVCTPMHTNEHDLQNQTPNQTLPSTNLLFYVACKNKDSVFKTNMLTKTFL